MLAEGLIENQKQQFDEAKQNVEEQKDKQKREEEFKKYINKLQTQGNDKDIDLTFYSFKKK